MDSSNKCVGAATDHSHSKFSVHVVYFGVVMFISVLKIQKFLIA
jgi:hypothetical protein